MREASMNTKKYAAEAIGTFWLTFAGCGSAVIAAGFPQVGIGLVGVSLAFGLSVVTMAYAIGHIRHGRPRGRRTVSGAADRSLCDRAGDRRCRGRGVALCDRKRRARLRSGQGLCLQRL